MSKYSDELTTRDRMASFQCPTDGPDERGVVKDETYYRSVQEALNAGWTFLGPISCITSIKAKE
jgi:hypothetical protein